MPSLAVRVLKGDRNAISRAITLVENREDGYAVLLKELYPSTGKALVVGVTGPPGTGKSSIVDKLVTIYRARGKRVAVLAIDPSSPISGGAILGDRVRMLEHSLDENVYIRSMASRGDPGGLSRAARNATRVLDASGSDIIFVETVGIGQAEVEIVKVADTVMVVLMPELGDEIQAIKAGLMEIGDIFVINKCDLPGADRVIYNLESVLSRKDGWQQIALKASAKTSQGMEGLVEKLDEHLKLAKGIDYAKKRNKERLTEELMENVAYEVTVDLSKNLPYDKEFHSLLVKLVERKIDPESASNLLLRKYLPKRNEK